MTQRGPGFTYSHPDSPESSPHFPHLYVHLPYCRRRCPYCHVAVWETSSQVPLHGLLAAVLQEMRTLRGELGEPLTSLYVGGGTPSFFPEGTMAQLADTLGVRSLPFGTEWTAEANPEDISRGRLDAWKRVGVTRLSLGLQSLSQSVLQALGRSHDATEGIRALEGVAQGEFASWNVDLILGPGLGGMPRLESDLRRILSFSPPHVTLAILEPGELAVTDVEWEQAFPDTYLQTRTRLEEAGLLPVDGVHFARKGHVSLHGQAPRLGEGLRGVGPGAHSIQGGHRFWNLDDPAAYALTVERGESPQAGEEHVSSAARRLEAIHLALASADGLLAGPLTPAGEAMVARWIRSGWCRWDGRRVHLTGEGWLRLDTLTLEWEGHLPPL
ncbi:MAG: radical SAM protein [Gemmatimonadota bacterium]